jgi:4-hydroxythreonine-4-phosphate dehydrogenase
MKHRPTLAITVGEPAGIGPEISLRAAWQLRHLCYPVLIGDLDFLRHIAQKIDPAISLRAYNDLALFPNAATLDEASLLVLHVPLTCPVIPGQLEPRNGLSVLSTLDLAIQGAMERRFDAIVTAPIQKSTINDAGVSFSGHTEYLAEKTNTPKVVMMLASSNVPLLSHPLRVALATTHIPLRDVSDAITAQRLSQTMMIIHQDLKAKFGIAHPVILVTGLNPHAGENGYLGREEIDVIEPAIIGLRAQGVDVRGPFPADTLFQEKYLKDADCVLAMYHDQGLTVLKYASLGTGVNITLGLPIIRTSVDHGTALDVAARGVGLANEQSMTEAIRVAIQLSIQTQ